MAGVPGKSGLMGKYGGRLDKAAREHANDETDYGFQRLPPGIDNGVAKLTKCYFDQVAAGKQNAGEYYFRAEGTVVEPYSMIINGVEEKIAGRTTSIMQMVCDQRAKDGTVTKTVEQNIAWILNEMRKLGGDEFTRGASGADLEALAAALVADDQPGAKPYFKFRTSQSKATAQYPNPRTWENWDGAIPDYVPPDRSGEEQDATGAAPTGPAVSQPVPLPRAASANGAKAPAATPPTAVRRGVPPASAPPASASSAPPAAEPFDDFGDIVSLIAKAESGESEAQDRLTEIALNAGADPDAVTQAESWTDVAKFSGWKPATVPAPGPAAKPAPADNPPAMVKAPAAGEWVPKKEDVYLYKPWIMNPRTKQKAKATKGKESEVIGVDLKNRTVTLLTVDEPRTQYENVTWEELESA